MIDLPFMFYGHGKLLLTGEYFVLDGAHALAVPTKLGQHLSVKQLEETGEIVDWSSIDSDGTAWFKGLFKGTGDYGCIQSSDDSTAKRIRQLLLAAAELQPKLIQGPHYEIETRLEFSKDWGLGSSSTLVQALAEWLHIDPYVLLQKTFGGSGYDLACAVADGPILYHLENYKPQVSAVDLNWPFKAHLHFVYLNEKQNSRDAIKHFWEHESVDLKHTKSLISKLAPRFVSCSSLDEFCALVDEHETLLSGALQLQRVKDRLFKDFDGSIKSLGAWGGDFVLAASSLDAETVATYFKDRGYSIVLSWDELVLENLSN